MANQPAFKRIAREVRLPGFRPGKAPRKVLEARIGLEAARGDALENSLPAYYADAVAEHEVDVIAAPEIDITDGEESGDVSFEAVVEAFCAEQAKYRAMLADMGFPPGARGGEAREGLETPPGAHRRPS